MYDMINIFEVFLPQLLRYPNPTDPLNGEAAALMMREPKGYEAKVKGELQTAIGSGVILPRLYWLICMLRVRHEVRNEGERGRCRRRLRRER